MTHLGLFEGIGGFSLSARWMGWETLAWCEWNEFCQKVLRYHFPDAEGFGDITKTDFTKYANRIDVLTGGFPCQPYSQAGKRKGKSDERHLWPEMLRTIREVQPSWVVGENVLGILNWSKGLVFHEVQTDLETEGFVMFPFVLPACAVGAPHRRDRVWFVAYSGSNGHKLRRFREDRSAESESISQQKQWKWFRQNVGRVEQQGITPNPNSGRLQTDHTLRKSEGENFPSRINGKGISADTENKRLEGQRGFAETEGLKGKIRSICLNERNSSNTITDTDSDKRFKGGMHQEGHETAERHISTFNASTNEWNAWDNFPTQPPICSRNDGLSPELVGITVSKHRTESIKAYGNSIVPQVALQIFKSIQEYEELNLKL